MTNLLNKLRGRCEACHKRKWFVRKRKVLTPIGQVATSQICMCDTCFKALLQVLTPTK